MVGFLEGRATTDSFRDYQAYTKRHAKTFYFASHMLPREKRMASYAVYAFCRYADNLVDTHAVSHETGNAPQSLAALRDQLGYVYAAPDLLDAKLRAFRDIVQRFQIPQEYFLDLLRGVEMDLCRTRYANFGELKEYCYCVASVVGLVMAKIFGASTDRALVHAADLGTAMQLTNILRDVREDYQLGRIYLPADEMQAHGFTEEDLRRGAINDSLRALMEFQVARARTYYASAAEGIPMLPDDGSRYCVQLMAATYSRILDVIEARNYNVFSGRAYVPLSTKIWIAVTVAIAPGGEQLTPLASDATPSSSLPTGSHGEVFATTATK